MSLTACASQEATQQEHKRQRFWEAHLTRTPMDKSQLEAALSIYPATPGRLLQPVIFSRIIAVR